MTQNPMYFAFFMQCIPGIIYCNCSFINRFVLIVLIFSLSACHKKEALPEPATDTLLKALPETVQIAKPDFKISYYLQAMDSAAFALLDSISRDNIKIILALNRIDEKHLWRQDTLVIPDTFLSALKYYSPFPDNLRPLKAVDKIIFFSYYVQAFAAYRNGELIRWGPVSMGKRSTPTPKGLFYTNWKAKQTRSSVNKEWIMNWYFNIESKRGISSHEYDLPGYPSSHSCIRLNAEDAFFLYHWADPWILEDTSLVAYGTPVIIFGEYPFGKRRPWHELENNNKALVISADSLFGIMREFLPIILDRQAKRGFVPPTGS